MPIWTGWRVNAMPNRAEHHPVDAYTEAEVRKALDRLGYWELDAEQIIEKLKECRHGRSAAAS